MNWGRDCSLSPSLQNTPAHPQSPSALSSPHLRPPRALRSAARPLPLPAASLPPRRSAAVAAAPPASSIRPAGTKAEGRRLGVRPGAAPLWSLPSLWGKKRSERRLPECSPAAPARGVVPAGEPSRCAAAERRCGRAHAAAAPAGGADARRNPRLEGVQVRAPGSGRREDSRYSKFTG